MRKTTLFKLPTARSERLLLQKFRSNFSVARINRTSESCAYLDTFDWRVYKRGFTLKRENNTFFLEKIGDVNNTITSIDSGSTTTRESRFWWDFPESALRQELKKYLSNRALLTMYECTEERNSFRVENEDKKTVARFSIIRIANRQSSPLQMFIQIDPIRGYDEQFDALSQYVDSLGGEEHSQALFTGIPSVYGVYPGQYSSKPAITVAPNEPAQQALHTMFRELVHIIRINEGGVAKDLDIEFLHDLRIAVRMVRTLLRLFADIIPLDVSTKLNNDMKWIGGLTGDTRDFDVYLSLENEYKKLLPEILQPGVHSFFRHVEERREKSFAAMKQRLESSQYQEALSYWTTYFSDLHPIKENVTEESTILHAVSKKIAQQYASIDRRLRKAEKKKTDKAFHALRIECKRLRYLFESFASLYSDEDIIPLIKQLKLLQEKLGDLNDISVQEQVLIEYLSDIDNSLPESIVVSAAVGGLITQLEKRKQEAKMDFFRAMEKFKKENNSQQFRMITGGEPEGVSL